jgi:hypothetical protein
LSSYIKPVTGLPKFALVSAISIVDPELSYPHRLVLNILALHANSAGKTEPSQERIAALAGWYKKDKTGKPVPNKSYVSSLISNANHVKKSDSCGPGLVQLGYVKEDHRQKGFNQTNTYWLTTPSIHNGYIQRPDGSQSKNRFNIVSKRENTKTYKARKVAERSEHELREVTGKKKFSAEDQIELPLGDDAVAFQGEVFFRSDCEAELRDWHDGLERIIPNAVYQHFGIKLPPQRESAF